MIQYSQSRGEFTDGDWGSTGWYAGRDGQALDGQPFRGKNNPNMQTIHMVGPLPQGKYTLSPPHDIPHLGVYVMALTPFPTNEMFGRSGFFVHGDNPAHPGESSDGCIVGDRQHRIDLWERAQTSGTTIEVTA